MIDRPPEPISDRQWGAYVQVCAERYRLRVALETIVASPMHQGHTCETCWIARNALAGEA